MKLSRKTKKIGDILKSNCSLSKDDIEEYKKLKKVLTSLNANIKKRLIQMLEEDDDVVFNRERHEITEFGFSTSGKVLITLREIGFPSAITDVKYDINEVITD